MNDPFKYADKPNAGASPLGVVDFWHKVTLSDGADNVLDYAGEPIIGIAIRTAGAITVAFHDRHGNAHSIALAAGEALPTSVKRILATGTGGGDIFAAISP